MKTILTRWWQWALIGQAVVWAVSLPAAELRLISTGSDNATEGGAPQSWMLEGDWLEHAELFYPSPSYRTTHTRIDAATDHPTHLQWTEISMSRTAPWTEAEVEDALAVFVWFRDERIEWMEVKSIQPKLHPSGAFPADAVKWDVSETAPPGSPVVLLHKDGKFLPPRPWFKSVAQQRMLVKIVAGATEGWEQELAQIDNLDQGASRGAGFTLLHVAAESDNLAAMEALVAAGADIDHKDFLGSSPLHWAANKGRVAATEWLLDHGAKHGGTRDRVFPLEVAIRGGHMAVAAEIYERLDSSYFRNEMLGAAARHGDRELSRKLLAEYSNLRIKFIDTEPLSQVLRSDDTELFQLMLERGLSPERRHRGVPLLNIAVHAGNVLVTRILLDAGANPNAHDAGGRTPLIQAVREENEVLVRMLLRAGAKINLKDQSRRTAGDYARERDLTAIAAWLDTDPAQIPSPSEQAEPPGARVHEIGEVDVFPRLLTRPDFVLMRGAESAPSAHYQGQVIVSSPLSVGGAEVLGVDPSQTISSSIVSTERTDHKVVWTGIVEVDGTVSRIRELSTTPRYFARNFDEKVADYRFVPGKVGGQPVRTRIVWLEDFRE
ncbi:ankyrin repeat domain-containing protein [Synoicihabitans lomoniglobus]|uniref:Ankyrin repeat domain-containing protein n=1 Tax=Synoicihabitans lomoniglobus TaxID=2909285 RepID=A0AAE9ZXI5_9BACT|nr:ankyrin repeat domain-containing protein [Opitutaceae bacterium LMO-M01]WED64934.1 ankyrin repeat domain-containing protein [Opitutaceae bacterium LMO-M01]